MLKRSCAHGGRYRHAPYKVKNDTSMGYNVFFWKSSVTLKIGLSQARFFVQAQSATQGPRSPRKYYGPRINRTPGLTRPGRQVQCLTTSNCPSRADNVESTRTPGIRRNHDGHISIEGNWCPGAQRATLPARLHHLCSATRGRRFREDYRDVPRPRRRVQACRDQPGSQPCWRLVPQPAPSRPGHDWSPIRADRLLCPGTAGICELGREPQAG